MRLIADVVTGKLDVRKADVELPEPGSVADDCAGALKFCPDQGVPSMKPGGLFDKLPLRAVI